MSSTELIKKLFLSFAKQDRNEFYKSAEEYIKLEKRKNHNVLVKELKEALYNTSISFNNLNENGGFYFSSPPVPIDNEKGFPLFEIKEFDFDWSTIILQGEDILILKQIVKEFHDKEILVTYNLQPKNKILFCGKPGTGKTFAAQIISSVLNIPLIYVRFDSIISSYLGETASNLRKVFDYINNGVWVTLFDEFDIIGKNRADQYEHGEIKRVVNNFLQMMDNFTGEGIIISATNHQHILDPAVWRRFDEVVYFKLPNEKQRMELIKLYLNPIKKENIDLENFVKKTNGFAPSYIKMMCIEAMKYSIINERKILKNTDIEYALKRFQERSNIRNGTIMDE